MPERPAPWGGCREHSDHGEHGDRGRASRVSVEKDHMAPHGVWGPEGVRRVFPERGSQQGAPEGGKGGDSVHTGHPGMACQSVQG